MIRRHWKVWGICFVILLIYLNYIQHDMVFAWLKPGADGISDKAEWIYLQYTGGKIVHARECLEVAEGWDALMAIWPLSLILVIVSLTAGIAGGYALRDDDNAASHERDLSDLESKYQWRIEIADRNYRQAEIWESSSRRRSREADQKEAAVKRREKSLEEKERDIDKIVEERVQSTRKQLQGLQEDHKNRCHKMEGLEKEKIDLKRKNISLEKEVIKLQEENLALTKENLALKRK